MTVKRFTHITALIVLVAFLAMHGNSLAAAVRTTPTVKYPPVDRWNWTNPLEGANYSMSQFKNGTIIAIRIPKNLQGAKKPYTVDPGDAYRIAPGRGPSDNSMSVYVPPESHIVYEFWQARKVSCEARRTVPDLFGNVFEVCQAAPFRFTDAGGFDAQSARGGVWIFTPPASGKQEPVRRSNRPGWGR